MHSALATAHKSSRRGHKDAERSDASSDAEVASPPMSVTLAQPKWSPSGDPPKLRARPVRLKPADSKQPRAVPTRKPRKRTAQMHKVRELYDL